MKKTRFWLILCGAALAAGAAVAATVTVLVKEAPVRRRPQFYATPAGSARLGDKFEGQGPKDGWYEVQGSLSGFIHQSAVTAKHVRLGSGSSVAKGGTTAEEITLAGKGFNSQVEKSYSAKNVKANFGAVDAMERRTVHEDELLDFMRAGGLVPEEAQ